MTLNFCNCKTAEDVEKMLETYRNSAEFKAFIMLQRVLAENTYAPERTRKSKRRKEALSTKT